jgi:hypothetical protein
MHLLGYLYEDYQDARSLEHKVYIAGLQAALCESLVFSSLVARKMFPSTKQLKR